MMPPEVHASMSPSRLQRIIDCPGSYTFAQEFESGQTSYAAEGTLLHLAVERTLRPLIKDQSMLSLPEFKELLSQLKVKPDIVSPILEKDQVNAAEDCIVYLSNILAEYGEDWSYSIWSELEVTMAKYDPRLYDVAGTADIVILLQCDADSRLIVADWKFGQGVAVYAEENDQLNAYACGAAVNVNTLRSYKRIDIHVVQPRLDNYDTVSYDPDALLLWMNERLLPSVDLALSQHPPFNPGHKQCRWCPANVGCKARHAFANEVAAKVFAVADAGIEKVSIEELADLLEKSRDLTTYISDIGIYLKRKIENGIPVPRFKIIAGRANRKWESEEKAEKWMTLNANVFGLDLGDLYTSKFISPAQAEKLNRQMKTNKAFQELIIKPEGTPTLVHESAKGVAIDYRTAEEKFKDALVEE